jgi:hypothetical protein
MTPGQRQQLEESIESAKKQAMLQFFASHRDV